MLNHINLRNVLFLDIETAPLIYQYHNLSKKKQSLWNAKMKWRIERDNITPERSYEGAGILSEFSRVVCVSVGYFADKDNFRIISFNQLDEKELLESLGTLLSRFFRDEDAYLCAHNGKEFDFPFLARRYLINGLELPFALDLAGKKPWEVLHLDTMQLWKFGDYKHYTSLDLLTDIFDIPSPKTDIDGSDVARLFHVEKAYNSIKEYCERDVLAVAQLILKWKGKEMLTPCKVVKDQRLITSE